MLLVGPPVLASSDAIASSPAFLLETLRDSSGGGVSESSIVHSAMDKFERQQWNDALVDLNLALSQSVDSQTRGFLYCARGICYFELGMKKRAQKDLKCATAVAPNQPSNWYQRAEVLFESGRLSEAWRCSNIAVTIDSQDPELLLQRARIGRALKRFEAAGRDMCAAVNVKKTQQ